jgi:DNA adenine methylase
MIKKSPLETSKPFLKWAGGKSQLISDIESNLPSEIHAGKSFTYIEPFVGSGAVLFYLLRTFPNLKKAVINDINPDLTKAYNIIKDTPEILIKKLTILQKEYWKLSTESDRKQMFYEKRTHFNTRDLDDIENTALLIFLNRTCFNGLYRVNSKGEFNVPHGKYHNPKICDEQTILSDSLALQKVKILNGDFEKTTKYATENSFFYLDPPYKPISTTSHFTAYSLDKFDDSDQQRLKNFCDKINNEGHYYMLSNSDLKNHDESNHFFDDLYSEYNITRVRAKRNINANSSGRGEISELLITNFTKETDLALAN